MVNNINTNPGALVALQNLTRITQSLEETQRRVSTGLEVSSAKDNPAIYALAQKQRAELGSIESVQQGLRIGSSTVDVALAAGEGISDLLIEMRALASQAADPSITAADRTLIQDQYVELAEQIGRLVDSATIGGRNLLDGSTATLSVNASTDGSSTIDIDGYNLTSASTSVLTIDHDGSDLGTAAGAATEIGDIDTSIDNLTNALANLGAGGRSLDLQGNLLTRVSDALEVSIGNLVDADLAKESSRLQALQVQQQLAIQTLSIANAAPNAILALFA
ncbi:MAG: flagellin [Marinicaulis sp.]|nr:flagellin [Marinicaulis sp.]NNE39396.1 flagellin [Marinicaulis sp.]NNL87901.1 flagellin [Marinicaulis sp.]